MKKYILLLLMVFMMSAVSYGDEIESSSLEIPPIITEAYEVSPGKLIVKWESSAPLYRVTMDGKKVADVAVQEAKFDISNGTHSIVVYPIDKKDKGDSTVHVAGGINEVGSLDVGFDLASIGLNAKNLVVGNPSEALNVDFVSDPIIDVEVEKPTAITDESDRVCISFADNYFADAYRVTLKSGKSENHVDFSVEDQADLITRDNATVTIILEPEYLHSRSCSAPELNQEYSFSVQLRKYATNILDNEPLKTSVHESKASKQLKYTPTAAWKAAPSITYASQTADGQVTLRWEHEDYDRGCQYEIVRVKKTLGVAKKDESIGRTEDLEYMISDLENGDYSYKVVPILEEEQGSESDEVKVEVANEWVVAPEISYEQTSAGEILLSWPVSDGVEKYHIEVLRGDSKSPLRYVNMDYKKYTELDIEDFEDNVEFSFSYDDGSQFESGDRLRFEVYGIRYTADGEEQKTSTTTVSVTTE